MKNKGLAAQLIFFIFTSTAAIFTAIFFYNYHSSRGAILAKTESETRNLTQATAYRIGLVLNGVVKVPSNLAALLGPQAPSRPELERLLRTGLAQNPEIFGMALAFEPYAYDRKLQYFCPYACREKEQIKFEYLGSESYQYFFYDWYQVPKELDRPSWSEPYFDEGGGNIIMSTFSVPLYQEAGSEKKFKGVITADLSLMGLTELVAAVQVYRTGYAFLISQNGVFVTHPDKKLIMRESIFGVAEGRGDAELRRIGRDMVRGGEDFVPLKDFFSGKKSWMYYAPLPSLPWSLGVIIPEDELFAQVNSLSRKLLIFGLLGLILLCVAIVFFSRSITRPLTGLTQATATLGHGDFSVAVPETGSREVVRLAHSFNLLGQQLTEYIEKRDFIRDTFGRYVTQEVVKLLLEEKSALELGGETREVSILMSDLRGFTAITADMAPEDIITFLNRYLGKMIEILVDHRAVIDEIVGDAFLAFFGAPEPMPNHPVQAVACALAMQGAMEKINAANAADGLPHLEMGIAVNTGAVVVGNIGSEKRTKYSVVGAHVNFTSRIESYAVGGQVLISQSTYERVKDLVEVGDTIKAEMKGVPEPATLYEVMAIGGPYNIRLKERCDTLVTLPQKIRVHLQRIQEKIVTGSMPAWITHICETEAIVVHEGELLPWEDVRLRLLDEKEAEIPGKIYGKVVALKEAGDNLQEANIRFTSISPEIYWIIQRVSEGT